MKHNDLQALLTSFDDALDHLNADSIATEREALRGAYGCPERSPLDMVIIGYLMGLTQGVQVKKS